MRPIAPGSDTPHAPDEITYRPMKEVARNFTGIRWLGMANAATPGDWAGLKLDTYSNDTNVDVIDEGEQAFVSGADTNSTPQTAQNLGTLAPNLKSGDDNSLAQDRQADTPNWMPADDADRHP